MDGKIGKRRLPSFSLDADIAPASRRRPLEDFSRKSFGAFTAQHYVESPRSQKRALGGNEIVGSLPLTDFERPLHHLKISCY
jgi:hypothetical protein